jgi:3-oxoadipate enol-lactonase
VPWTAEKPSLHYRRCGERGPRLALVHEIGGSLESWEPVAARLAGEFQLLGYDGRGAGLSEKPRGRVSPADQVDDLEAVLDAAGWGEVVGEEGEDLLLAGAAAGSAVAAGFALRHPGRVAALALCVPSLESSPEQLTAAAERNRVVRREGMRGLADPAFAAIYPEAIRDERFAEYRGRWLAHDPESFALLSEAFAAVELPLAQLRPPCLLLGGELDPARPPAAVAELAGRIPGARVETVPGAAHVAAFQAPEEVARRLRSFFSEAATLTPLRGVRYNSAEYDPTDRYRVGLKEEGC